MVGISACLGVGSRECRRGENILNRGNRFRKKEEQTKEAGKEKEYMAKWGISQMGTNSACLSANGHDPIEHRRRWCRQEGVVSGEKSLGRWVIGVESMEEFLSIHFHFSQLIKKWDYHEGEKAGLLEFWRQRCEIVWSGKGKLNWSGRGKLN